MAEGAHIPETPACGEWETLLAEALDGLLSPEDETRFLAHKAACPACTALYEEARRGCEWLEFLSPEPEPPEGLLEKILATTGPGHKVSGLPAPAGEVPAFVPPVWQQPGLMTRMRHAAQPRLMMTAAMAFFSIALTLNLTGIELRNLRLANLRPRAVRSYMVRQLNMASVPIVRYYDHLRFVYEVEARVRELRSQTGDESNGAGQDLKQTQPATPGETRKNPGPKPGGGDGGLRVDPQLQPGTPRLEPASRLDDDVLETSLGFPMRSMQSGGYMVQRLKRSTPWIA